MQYSGEEDFNKFSTPKQVEQCLRSFDLSEYRRVITDVAIWIYQGVTKLMEEEIQPLLVPAIIEHEGIGGISGDKPGRPRGSTSEATDGVYVDPSEALNKLLHLLSRFNSIFTKHGLDPMLITRIFKETFYFICAGSLNNLLLRKDMCHWSRGMQIRYNVAQLEQWARDEKIHDQDRSPALDALNPIIQASQLLQVIFKRVLIFSSVLFTFCA
jgi:myosin-5